MPVVRASSCLALVMPKALFHEKLKPGIKDILLLFCLKEIDNYKYNYFNAKNK
jgi:hypothetical protein